MKRKVKYDDAVKLIQKGYFVLGIGEFQDSQFDMNGMYYLEDPCSIRCYDIDVELAQRLINELQLTDKLDIAMYGEWAKAWALPEFSNIPQDEQKSQLCVDKC